MTQQPSILIIGEVCMDTNLYCKVERICPEAPVAVHVPLSSSHSLGMAANVSNNLVSLGARTTYLFPKHTIEKIRHVDQASGYILVRVDIGDQVPPDSRFSRQDFQHLFDKEELQAIVISDYNKLYLSEDDIAFIAEKAKERGIPTFLDTKKILGPFSKEITFVKINNKEYQQQLAKNEKPEDLCENMIVTLGPKGSLWVDQNITVPTLELDSVVDITGCGDVFLAGLAIRYVETGDIVESMKFANVAASISATKRGTVNVMRQDVEKAIRDNEILLTK